MVLSLLESPYFALEHDANQSCLYATWRGPQDLPHTRANYELILRVVEVTGCKKLLNDALLDQNGWRELTSWLAQDCFQQLTQHGIEVVAWILPRNQEALFTTRQVLTKLKYPLVETFSDAEAAYRWLHLWPRPSRSNTAGSYL